MHLESYVNYLQHERRYAQPTIVSYRNDLRQFSAFSSLHYSKVPLAELDKEQIRAWIVSLMKEGYSAVSVNRKISALRGFYRFLLKQGEIQRHPMQGFSVPKTKKRLPQFVEEKQMHAILDGGTEEQEPTWQMLRDLCIVEMLYSTGIRRAELMALRTDSIHWDRSVVRVLGKRNKERDVPLVPPLLQSIRTYLESRQEARIDSPYLFVTNEGKPLYGNFVYRLVKSRLGEVSTMDKRSPHVLRHTFATRLLNRGADLNAIKELLGHASLSATQVYTHGSLEQIKRSYKQAHPRG